MAPQYRCLYAIEDFLSSRHKSLCVLQYDWTEFQDENLVGVFVLRPLPPELCLPSEWTRVRAASV